MAAEQAELLEIVIPVIFNRGIISLGIINDLWMDFI
jgi:hypothetical protein